MRNFFFGVGPEILKRTGLVTVRVGTTMQPTLLASKIGGFRLGRLQRDAVEPTQPSGLDHWVNICISMD